jgi:glycosyltransferase involved in cell wall biosynthesis/8-oxo-dGTP pyrophosphatase MutT (NUDIX family)
MLADSQDKVHNKDGKVFHESAGGFVFYEDPLSRKLSVALLKASGDRLFVPKGHLQGKETAEAAALREITEELSFSGPLTLVTSLGNNRYSYAVEGSSEVHIKTLHLFLYRAEEKFPIFPLRAEGYTEAQWFDFEEAREKIAFHQESLLKARQQFYFLKPVHQYPDIAHIRSLTVGIPTRNGARTIRKTLDSVSEALNFLPSSLKKKIVICFDHCTDNCEGEVQKFIAENSARYQFEVLQNLSSSGKSLVLNLIVQHAHSDIICFVDDDVDLKKNCFHELLFTLISHDQRVVCASWVRKKLITVNPWKRFWYYVLGVKFDLPGNMRPFYIRGACLMLRNESFVYLPNLFNEDQFFQYIYTPAVAEVESAQIEFQSASSLKDYYHRFVRITLGSLQLHSEFDSARIKECDILAGKKLYRYPLKGLDMKQRAALILYNLIKSVASFITTLRLSHYKKYEWYRINK